MSARLDLFAASNPRDTARSAAIGPLFSTPHVIVGTLLGTPLAGAAMMALNARRLGESAVLPLAFGVGVVASQVALYWAVGASVAGLGLAATSYFAYTYQHDDVSLHLRRGARGAPLWEGLVVTVVGLACAVAAAAAMIACVSLLAPPG
jgi:hypothetical protein